MTSAVAPGGGRWLAVPMLAASLAAFAGVLSGGALYFRDLMLLHRPVRQVVRAQWAAGWLPLWDPLADGGRPLLANPNHLILHPVALLDSFLPVDGALAAAAILQVFLAGWGLALLLRRQGATPAAARLGGLAWALSGPVLSLGNLPNLLAGVAWVPLAVWAGLRSLERPGRWLPVAALLLAVPMLAGGAEVPACTLLLLACLAAGGPGSGRRLAVTAGVGAGGFLLAAVQLLPAWAALAESERGIGFRPEQILHWSMPPQRLLEAAIPQLWGSPVEPAAWWGSGLFDMEVPLILSTYLGGAVLALAVVGAAGALRPHGLSGRRDAAGSDDPPQDRRLPPPLRRLVLATGTLGVVLVFLALGRHNPILAWEGEAPVAGAVLRFPERLLPLAALAAAVAAAAGWQILARARREARPLPLSLWPGLGALAGLYLLAGGAALGGRFLPGLTPGLPPGAAAAAAARLVTGSATGLVGLVALAGCLWLARRRAGAAAALAALLVSLELLGSGVGLNPTVEPEILEELPAAAALIAAESRQEGLSPRLVRAQEPQVSSAGIPPGVEVAWSRRSLSVRVPEEFGLSPMLASDVDRSAPLGNAFLRVAHAQGSFAARERLADRAAAAWELSFLAPGAPPPAAARAVLTIFPGVPALVVRRRSGAAPRASLVPRGEHVGDLAAPGTLSRLLQRMGESDIDPRETVFLTSAPPAGEGGGWAAGDGRLEILAETPTEIVLRAQLPGPGLLVLRDSFTAGWRAWVDGERRPIRRADLAWRAVELPAGVHHVRFRYHQPGLAPGAALTGLGLLLCAALPLASLVSWRRRARARRAAGGAAA